MTGACEVGWKPVVGVIHGFRTKVNTANLYGFGLRISEDLCLPNQQSPLTVTIGILTNFNMYLTTNEGAYTTACTSINRLMTFGTFPAGAGIVRTGYRLAITGTAAGSYTYQVTYKN